MLKLLILLMIPELVLANVWQDLWFNKNQQGSHLLKQNKNKEAAQIFTDKNWKGIAYYRDGKYRLAYDEFKQDNSAQGLYNQGNALAHLQKYEEAITAYNKSLELQKNSPDTTYNKELVEKLLQQQKQQQNNQKDKQSDKDKSGQDSKQQQNQNQSGQKDSKQQQNNQDGKQSDKDKSEQNSKQQQNGKQKNDGQNSADKQNKDQSGQKGSSQQDSKQQGKDKSKQTDSKDGQSGQQPNTKDGQQQGQQQKKQSEDQQQKQQQSSGQNTNKEQQTNSGKPEAAAADKTAKPENKAENKEQTGIQNNIQAGTDKTPNGQAPATNYMRPQTPTDVEVKSALSKIPDDPGGLLRNKFLRDYQQQGGNNE